MGIVSALYTGVTGLQTLGNSIQVTGNNIANVNTVGFKTGRAEFSDLLYQTINVGGGTAQIGRGVQLESVAKSFAQGSFLNTDSVSDLAISGKGFFMLRDELNSTDYYTRAGNFRTDDTGDLVSTDGYGVQGFLYDAEGIRTGNRGTINLSNLTSQPHATDEVSISSNLDSEAPVQTFDPLDPSATSSYSTSMTIYDSLGTAHNMIVYFSKTEAASPGTPPVVNSTWEWNAVIDGSEIEGGTAGVLEVEASGTLVFNKDGELADETTTSSLFDFIGGPTQGQVMAFDFGDALSEPGGTGLLGTTQFAGSSVTNFMNQNGYQTGALQAMTVDSDGLLTGVFSNGRTRVVAQIALAGFQSEDGLFATGSNLFIETPDSGQPTVAPANTGAIGSVAGNTLELSNVDLSTEFVSLIANQRGFQANSRIVSVGSELLAQIVQLGQ